MREKIVETAINLFKQMGVNNVTMDQLASSLGISKKTIYQYFRSKKELVCATTLHFTATRSQKIKALVKSANDSVEALFYIVQFALNEVRQLNPIMLYELQKYYPEAQKLFQEKFDGKLRTIIEEIIKQGIEEGYFRDNIKQEIISYIFIVSKQAILDIKYNLFSKFELKDVLREFLYMFVSGICTEKGLKRIKELHSTKL